MPTNDLQKTLLRTIGCLLLSDLMACGVTPQAEEQLGPSAQFRSTSGFATPSRSSEFQRALAALDKVEELSVSSDETPLYIRGQLGYLRVNGRSAPQPENLATIARLFRLSAGELVPSSSQQDELGFTHSRYAQTKDGLPVVGGDVVLHADAQGAIYAINGTARNTAAPQPIPTVSLKHADELAVSHSPSGAFSSGQPRLVYLLPLEGDMRLCWEVEVRGEADGSPSHDRVYVEALSGDIIERHPLIHAALNRKVYTANNTSSLPGMLRRSEGGAPDLDSVINVSYDRLGATSRCYADLFGRDSYDGAGAVLASTVHYGTRYNNAFWDGSQMVYGDGDGGTFGNFATSLDVTAHELTHAVTERTAGLIYRGESGALNESMSDVFGNICEAYQNGTVDARTWMVGEDIYTPGTSGDALRYMDNPTRDGYSTDYYPQRYVGSADNGGVHWNSGIANLAFYLASQGGMHPRGKTSISVPAQGISKTRQIWYRALAYYMSPSTTFQQAQDLTAQAALDLYGAAARDAVLAAWKAVGVGRRAAVCGRGSGGILCALPSGSTLGSSSLWEPSFSNLNDWNSGPQYYSTIQYPDINGDGRSDVCGRGSAGVLCAPSSGSSFAPISLWQSNFSDANGWNNGPEYYSTIKFADVNGDGKADVCGRSSGGIYCALSTGTGFGPNSLWLTDFSDANGWNGGPRYYSTIQFADMNGDGKADVCGRGGGGIHCALSTGTSFGRSSLWQGDFSDANGWGDAQYYSTIRLIDLNGDGKADLCGRGSAGIDCALSSGTGFGPLSVWQGDFSDRNGWATDPHYYSTIQFADLNADGKMDLCGRGNSGMNCALSTGTSFGPSSLWHTEFSDPNGWSSNPRYYSTIQLLDLNGDGKADICGRASSGMACALSNGASFGTLGLWQPEFSDANGWGSGPQYYSTIKSPVISY